MNLRKLFIDFSTRHDLYYRLFVIIGSILIITGYLPSPIRFKYEFSAGGTWNYEDLKAPFDFPVYKTDIELDAEKKAYVQEQLPCYRVDSSIQSATLKTFSNNYGTLSQGYSDGVRVINDIYKRGYIDLRKNLFYT